MPALIGEQELWVESTFPGDNFSFHAFVSLSDVEAVVSFCIGGKAVFLERGHGSEISYLHLSFSLGINTNTNSIRCVVHVRIYMPMLNDLYNWLWMGGLEAGFIIYIVM